MNTKEIFAALSPIRNVRTMPAGLLLEGMRQWQSTCRQASTYYRGLAEGQETAGLMHQAANTLKGLVFGSDQGILRPREAVSLVESNVLPLLRQARALAKALNEPKPLSEVTLPKDGTWKEKLAAVKQATAPVKEEVAEATVSPQTNYGQLVRDTQASVKKAVTKMVKEGRHLRLLKGVGIIPTATTDIRNSRYIQSLHSVGGTLANTYGEGTDFTVLTQETLLLVHEDMLEGRELPIGLLEDMGRKLGTKLELMSTVSRGQGDTPIRAFWVATSAHRKALLEAVRFYRTGRTVQSWGLAQ